VPLRTAAPPSVNLEAKQWQSMYTLIRENLPFANMASVDRSTPVRGRISSTVLLLGLTSLFTDISSEMVTTVLPLYFIFGLGLTPVSFAIIDGLYQGVSTPLRIIGGVVGDRLHRNKEIATLGYAISAPAKIGLLLVGPAVPAFVGMLLLDRVGKGLRSSPRDAMISQTSPPESLGFAFGVHRALDTLGALIGPLLAFALLQLMPDRFDVIFVASFFIALIGLGIVGLLVEERPNVAHPGEARKPSLRDTMRLLRQPGFGRLLAIAGALSIFTISDSLLYLVLQRRNEFDVGLFPLLFIGTACVYFILAIPAGALADRFGRVKVFAGGYVLLLLTYTVLLQPAGNFLEVGLYLILFGGYYAATDGVLMALASTTIPDDLRASGLAVLTSVTSLGRFGGSVSFGLIWTMYGEKVAIAFLLGGLSVATIGALTLVKENQVHASSPS
jgi:MFS family permease